VGRQQLAGGVRFQIFRKSDSRYRAASQLAAYF
jgi:hypothetical protein